MNLWFKNFRISILNWLAAGRIKIEKDKKPEPVHTLYTLGTGLAYNQSGGLQYNTQQPQVQKMNLIPSINFNVAKANGGWIVQINQPQSLNVISLNGMADTTPPELYLISDDADFDKELGKIISMSCLKA